MKNHSAAKGCCLTLVFLCVSLAACSPQAPQPNKAFELSDIDPRSQVIGVVPNVPTAPASVAGVATAPTKLDAPGVKKAVPTDVTAKQLATKMPLPGQANDHSTLSKVPSQHTTGQATK